MLPFLSAPLLKTNVAGQDSLHFQRPSDGGCSSWMGFCCAAEPDKTDLA